MLGESLRCRPCRLTNRILTTNKNLLQWLKEDKAGSGGVSREISGDHIAGAPRRWPERPGCCMERRKEPERAARASKDRVRTGRLRPRYQFRRGQTAGSDSRKRFS